MFDKESPAPSSIATTWTGGTVVAGERARHPPDRRPRRGGRRACRRNGEAPLARGPRPDPAESLWNSPAAFMILCC